MKTEDTLTTRYAELCGEIRKAVKASVKEKRYEHSERVAQTAFLMCGLYNIDKNKGYLAGLAHDLCKDMDEDEMVLLAKRDGQEITEVEIKKPSLLHGRAAAIKLREEFGIDDKEILEAVALHTLGGKNVCDLTKIVFAADKIEPGRPQSTEEYRENLFKLPLNEMCKAVLKESFDYLQAKGKEPAPVSREFFESLS